MAMNIIQLQDNLKNLSDQQLTQAMQMPSQDTPPFLVVSELNRRKQMRDSFQAQQASQNQTTVAQDVVAAAGVPQQAASDMAQSLAPQTDMANNTGIMSIPQGGEPQQMAGGGVVKMDRGGSTPVGDLNSARSFMPNPVGVLNDPILITMASRQGMSVNDYLQAMDPESRQAAILQSALRANRDVGATLDFSQMANANMSEAPFNPSRYTEQPVNPSYEEQLTSVFPPDPEPVREQRPDFESYGREGAPTSRERGYAARLPTFDDILAQGYAAQDQVSDNKLIKLANPALFGTQLAYDALGSGEFMEVPTLTAQAYNAFGIDLPKVASDVANAASTAYGAASTAYDTVFGTKGDPYSELTPDELNALASGKIPPEAADALQAARIKLKTAQTDKPLPPMGGPAKTAAQDKAADAKLIALANAAPAAAAVADKAAADAKAKKDAEAAAGGAGGAGGSGGSGGAGGSGKPSTYEQMLMDAMTNADKKAKQDKWLAVAQMGLALMSSAQPNIGMALGEAGAAALPLYQQARDTADASKMDAAKGLYAIEQARAAAAAAAARANAPGKPKAIDVGALTALDSRIKELSAQLLTAEGAERLQIAERLDVLQQRADLILSAYLQQRGGISSVPLITEDPEDSADLSTPQ